MKSFLTNVGLVMVSVLVGFGVLELIVRSYVTVAKPYAFVAEDPNWDTRSSVYDTRGFWTWKPGLSGYFDNRVDFTNRHVTINGYGGRTVPCAGNTQKSRTQVFLIGDSQTFGWGLSNEETWANLLQCELNRRHPDKFVVHNLGFPGAQVDQLYSRGIGQVEPAVNPDDVVVISFTWNDLVTYYGGPVFVEKALKQSGLEKLSPSDPSYPEVRSIVAPQITELKDEDHRKLEIKLLDPIQYLRQPSWRYPIYIKYGVFIPSFDSWWSFLNSIQYYSAAYQVAWSHARLIYYRFRPPTELFEKIPQGTFSSNFLILKALETRLKRKGAKVLIQLLPNRLFFDDYYYHSYSKNGVVFPARDYLGYVGRPLCQSLRLKCVNRFDNLVTARRNAHSFAFDGHFNPVGSGRIATALANDLIR